MVIFGILLVRLVIQVLFLFNFMYSPNINPHAWYTNGKTVFNTPPSPSHQTTFNRFDCSFKKTTPGGSFHNNVQAIATCFSMVGQTERTSSGILLRDQTSLRWIYHQDSEQTYVSLNSLGHKIVTLNKEKLVLSRGYQIFILKRRKNTYCAMKSWMSTCTIVRSRLIKVQYLYRIVGSPGRNQHKLRLQCRVYVCTVERLGQVCIVTDPDGVGVRGRARLS